MFFKDSAVQRHHDIPLAEAIGREALFGRWWIRIDLFYNVMCQERFIANSWASKPGMLLESKVHVHIHEGSRPSFHKDSQPTSSLSPETERE